MAEKKIMIVDDEPSIRKLMIHAFERGGYTVLSAGTDEEAIKILENEQIQVFFLDLKLPGKSGLELCRIIKNTIPQSVIYAVTGYCSDFEKAQCLEAGFDDYLSKPCELTQLYEAAVRAFEKIQGNPSI